MQETLYPSPMWSPVPFSQEADVWSQDASRFLAQSQSRLSNFGQPDANEPSSRQPQEGSSRYSRHPARSSYQARLGNPYQPSNSRFGSFASRYNTAPDAPLFHSALNEFREDEDEDDVREAADLRALQHSRRVFVSSRMEDSSASENDTSRASLEQSGERDSRTFEDRGRTMGIKSSWNGESNFKDRHSKRKTKEEPDASPSQNNTRQNSESDESGKMVDIGLDSMVVENQVPEDLLQETPTDSSPPAFQQFKSTKATRTNPNLERDQRLMRQAIAEEDEDEEEGQPPNEIPSAPQPRMYGEIFVHDQFFAWIYLIAFASLLATFVLVWLHTSVPGRKIGDTIYTTLHSSFSLLAVDTLVAVIVALVWMAALRSFVQPLVVLILLGVPVVLFSFSLYPMISSFQGPDHGRGAQDIIMRYAAIVPGVCAIIWTWLLYKGRHEIHRAIDILDFASRILAANPALVLLGFGSLAFVVGWTWVWLWMFTRIFLGGYFSKSLSAFVIGTATWWLAIFFFLMYVWTLSVMSGVVRATTGGTVSNWYFHRNHQTPATSNAIVKGALGHSTTTVFGTICASTLLSLAVRVPILILPRRISSIFEFIGWRLAPRPVSVLTNPLALTYASIHSLPLMESASQLSRIQFLSTGPTTTLTPSAFSRRNQTASLMPYRMAKMLLHAARFVMSTALGFAAWVMTARQLQVQLPDGLGIRGSAYAYVVGMVASMIGWGVLGAMEGILSGILDGVLICYASERRLGSDRATYCIEAAKLFEDRGHERDMV
ncbi:Uu.00g071440.m01.CDS01 [Anthostomella pinea]|uniref:Protein PNS1 n=1 Tax=Anthostomella pinea TaxID=933095 RepID=A0AAI8VVN7_9PEZI|nr:Uu.00g071440.m01.CDS01 [Anthostomella pinea]